MLIDLLRRHDIPNPTWKAIMDALRHVTVGEETAAYELLKYLELKAAEGTI